MLVCVPTSNNAGMEGVVHEHFGSAPFFTLYNTESESCEVIENRNAHHSHGTCHPMNQLTKFKIDAIVCSGMGRRAVETLKTAGIRAMVTKADNVKEAISQLADGVAQDIDPATACRGHGHKQHLDSTVEEFGRRSGSGNGRREGNHHGQQGNGRGRVNRKRY